jgi:probable F420-dependent oxidoreductase
MVLTRRYAGLVQPFRFGVTTSTPPRGSSPGEAWAGLARRAEALGYGTLLIPDHLGRQLAPIAALTAAAAATRTIRVGPYVFANDYRHPLILAGEAATLDVLSGGRLELGLGAGWRVTDYRWLGLPYDEPKVRVSRLIEATALLKRLFAGGAVTHAGVHYQLDGAQLFPLPIQKPHPPIQIGGGGPRMLRFAAREADIVGLLPQFDRAGRPIVTQATEAATENKADLVRFAAGDRWAALELNVIVFDAGLVGSGAGPLTTVASAAKAAAVGLIGTPYVLYGTLGRLRDLLLRRRDRTGINYYALPARCMETMAPLVESLSGR